jgi:2-phosphosulfolactate phosphatase
MADAGAAATSVEDYTPTMRHEGLLLDDACLAADRALLPAAAARPRLSIVDLPESLTQEHTIEASFAVLIDVQRMTTTLTTAIAEGAEKVRVFREIDEVQAAAADYEPTARLRGGERHGQKIDGFDGDNSPRAYLRSVLDLSGKTLLFTTTNGSKAAQFVKQAAALVLGSFVNLQGVRRAALSQAPDVPVLLVCSGTNGERSDEDELFAGVLALQLLQVNGQGGASAPVEGEVADALTLEIVQRAATILGVTTELTIAGSAAAAAPAVADGAAGRGPAECAAELEHTIRTSTNGIMLAKLGLVEDFEVILDVDRYGSTLPVYDQGADSFSASQ